MSFANNSSYNNNYTLPSIKLKALDIIAIIIMCGIVLVGVVGNSIVIYIFGIKPGKSRKRFNTFLLLLGVVDFISSLVVPFPFIYLTATDYQMWHFGYIGCKIIPSFLQISVTVSQGVLILICFERYQAIVHPFKSRLTKVKICLWLQLVAGITVIVSIPYIATFQVISDPFYKINTCVPAHGTISTLLISAWINLTRDLLAASILIYLSYQMRKSLLQKHVTATWNRAKFSEKGRRLLVIVIVVFIILTLPVDIFRVVTFSLFKSISVSDATYEVLVASNLFLNIVQMTNSVVNVFIYSRVHSNFSSFLKSIIRRRTIERVRWEFDQQTDESWVHISGPDMQQDVELICYSTTV